MRETSYFVHTAPSAHGLGVATHAVFVARAVELVRSRMPRGRDALVPRMRRFVSGHTRSVVSARYTSAPSASQGVLEAELLVGRVVRLKEVSTRVSLTHGEGL